MSLTVLVLEGQLCCQWKKREIRIFLVYNVFLFIVQDFVMRKKYGK